MQTLDKFLFSALLIVFLGTADAQLQRLPLRREHPTLATSSKPTSFGEGQTIRYDAKSEVYIISYKGAEGESEQAYFELPTKADVVVLGSVESAANGVPLYKYTVHSLPNSREGVSVFVVTSPIAVQQPAAPDKGWMIRLLPGATFPNEKGVDWSDIQKRSGIPAPMIPYVRTPAEAIEKKGGGFALWSPLGIPPGKSQGGFSFRSDGLPGIVNCFAQSSDFTTVMHGEIADPYDTVTLENSFIYLRGRTIGPVLEPGADASAIIRNLDNSINEARTLNWMAKESQISNTMDAVLAAWRTNYPDDVRKHLGELISVAKKENGKSITSELYGIVKFNAEALLKKGTLNSR